MEWNVCLGVNGLYVSSLVSAYSNFQETRVLHCLRHSTHSFPTIPESIFMTRPPYPKWRCSIVVTRGAMEKPVHLDWLRINYKVALRWHFHCGCPISKPRSVLDFSSKIRDRFFFQKIKKWARMTRKGVIGDFSKKLMVFR